MFLFCTDSSSTDENFNDVVRLNAVMFKHKADIATRICESFDNGAKLFPDDLLMQHWGRTYKDSNVISKRTVLMNKLDNPQMTMAEVDAEVRSLGFDIQDYRPAFTADELNEQLNLMQNNMSFILILQNRFLNLSVCKSGSHL